MSSFDIRGKYWILPDSSILDVTCDEHARFARAAMLKIPYSDMYQKLPLNKIFQPLGTFEATQYLSQGANWAAVLFLSSNNFDRVDPRLFAIERWGWIRSRENKFYAWEWDEKTISALVNALSFWDKTTVGGGSWLDFVELKTEREFGMTYGKLVSKAQVWGTNYAAK